MVSCIARYHRKKFPHPSHVGYQELLEPDRKVVDKLSAILRLADGLDREHRQLVKTVKLTHKASVTEGVSPLRLSIEGEGDLLLDRWSVKLKSDLFQHVFARNVEIVDPESAA